MKGVFVFAVFVLVGMVSCENLVSSQNQPRSINSGRRNDSDSQQKNRESNSRSLSSSSGSGNRVHQSDDDDDDTDSAFDNGPTAAGDSSEITFPVDDYYHPRRLGEVVDNRNNRTGGNRWKKIPLNALVKFGSETSLASFFKTYVKNTKIVRDNDTLEEYLADAKGDPILDAKKDKVVVTVPVSKPIEPSIRVQHGPVPLGMGVKGRAGGAIFEQKAKSSVDLAMVRSGVAVKEQKQSISLPVCSPELATVPVPLHSLKVDPSMLVIPKCLKVERCGGCCLSDLTVCEPETTEKVKFTVTLLGYDGDSEGTSPQLQFVNTSTVEIDKHKTCKCKCRTKREHCKSHFHKYDENQCSCICTNVVDHQRCLDNPDNRIWDNESCMCTCQDVKECSSGYFFDMNSCDCQLLEMRKLLFRPRPLRS